MRHAAWAVALVTVLAAAIWPAATPQRASGSAVAMPAVITTAFRPSRHGFEFRNPRPDPADSALRRYTSGRCGGMTYASLDAFSERKRPSIDTVDSPRLVERSVDSIVSNVARFALWSAWPSVRADGPVVGIGTLTRAEELPRLASALRDGPVPLGLVRARSLADIGRNHQVVVYAMKTERDRVVLSIYDSCQPKNDDVQLVIDRTDSESIIREYASGYLVATWRGAFVERYAPPADRRF